MASIPFIRLNIKKIDKEAFKWQDENNPLILVVLTQNKPTQESDYTTSKIHIMGFNGQEKIENWCENIDARVTDKFRRFELLLISKETLFPLCPLQAANPLDGSVGQGDAALAYDDLKNYAEWHFDVTLRDLSLFCRDNNLNSENGKISLMKNDSGEKAEISYYVQLLNAGDPTACNEHMKKNIWNSDESDSEYNNNNKNLTGRRDGVGRGAMRDRNIKEIIPKRNHAFKLTYFSDPRECSVCHQFVWGILKKQGYQCTKCNRVCHAECIKKVLAVCTAIENEEMYQIPSNEGRMNVPHRLKRCTNWSFAVKKCRHTGKMILPFNHYYICTVCKLIFKQNENLGNNCGVNEFKQYEMLKQIKNDKNLKSTTQVMETQDCIYQPVGKIHVQAGDRENALMDNLAHGQQGVLDKLNLDKDTSNQIKVRKMKSQKRIKDSKFNDFKITCVLGQGSYGKVLLAKYKSSNSNKTTNNWLAIKAIRKDVTLENYDVEAVHLEKDILSLEISPGKAHPFLANAICTFHDPRFLYYVMEFLSGGDLMAYVLKRGCVPEEKVKVFGIEILLGLRFLHRKNIIYRDLKLDNVMIGPDGHVRIADFGMVRKDVEFPNRLATTFCGTPDYMAPEILTYTPYCFKVDIWAFAVVIFEMTEGFSPFQGSTEDKLFHCIKWEKPRYRFCKKMSKTLKDMLDNCFMKIPKERFDVNQVISHPFFSKDFPNADRVENLEYPPADDVPPVEKDKFLNRFDEEATKMDTDLVEDDIRTISEREDQVFVHFSWNSPKVKLFQS